MFCSQASWGQNLIPNGSFEDTISYGGGFTFPKQWKSPSGNNSIGEHYTPYNQYLWTVPKNFFGYQHAVNGNSYFGMAMYILYYKAQRDYIQCRLKRPLIKDSTYCLQIYVNLPDSMTHASRGQLGIYLSNSAISSTSNGNLPYTPQLVISPINYITDKVNWTEFNLQYTAQGGECYLTMGNFNDTLGIDTLYSPGGGIHLNYFGTYYFIDNLYFGHCDSIPKDFDISSIAAVNNNPCFTDSTYLSLTIKNRSIDSISFTEDTLTLFTEVFRNGNLEQSFQQSISNNTLNFNGGLFSPDSSITIPLNPIDLSQMGQAYRLKIYAHLTKDEDTTNNIIDTLLFNDLSIGNVSLSNSSICAGTTIELKSEGSIGESQWQYSSNQIDWFTLSSDTIATHQPLETTFYRFVICDFYYSDTLMVEVNNPSNPYDTVYELCNGVENVIYPSQLTSYDTLLWYKNLIDADPFFIGDSLIEKFYENRIFYIANLKDSCISLSRGKITIKVKDCLVNFSIYPNPAKNVINLEYSVREDEQVNFELIDVLGRFQLKTQLNASNLHQINLDNFSAGIYFYRLIKNEKVTQSGKLIIE